VVGGIAGTEDAEFLAADFLGCSYSYPRSAGAASDMPAAILRRCRRRRSPMAHRLKLMVFRTLASASHLGMGRSKATTLKEVVKNHA
jgi:hypothetical protein